MKLCGIFEFGAELHTFSVNFKPVLILLLPSPTHPNSYPSMITNSEKQQNLHWANALQLRKTHANSITFSSN